MCWAIGDTLYPLRIPTCDSGGFAETVVVEWSPQPSVFAPKFRHHGVWAHIRDWIDDYLEMQGEVAQNQAMVAQAEAQAARGAFIALERRAWSGGTKFDTIGVGLDVVAVGLTIGFASGGLALIALYAGAVLLFVDGSIWATEMAGYGEAAEDAKSRTAVLRWGLILAALPDAAVGLFNAVKETPDLITSIGELRQERAATQARALKARAGAGRMGRQADTAEGAMARARYRAISEKYADYAEGANARAQKEARNLQILRI